MSLKVRNLANIEHHLANDTLYKKHYFQLFCAAHNAMDDCCGHWALGTMNDVNLFVTVIRTVTASCSNNSER
jgi:hypothetical protein